MNKPNITWAEIKKYRFSFILLIVVIAGILLTHFLWILPIIDDRETLSMQVGQQRELVKKYQEKLSKAEGLKQELQKQEEELKQLQGNLFQGGDPYQLAATLAEPFSEGSQNLDIKSYQVVATKDYGFYQEVQLKFSFTTNINGLYQFLENMQKKQGAIFVQEMDIRSMRRGKSTSLVVNVVLAALMEKGGKS